MAKLVRTSFPCAMRGATRLVLDKAFLGTSGFGLLGLVPDFSIGFGNAGLFA